MDNVAVFYVALSEKRKTRLDRLLQKEIPR